jgi:hypothetical protein
MARHVTATLALDFYFDSDGKDWNGVKIDLMSDEEFEEFVTEEFWSYVADSKQLEISIEEHIPYG